MSDFVATSPTMSEHEVMTAVDADAMQTNAVETMIQDLAANDHADEDVYDDVFGDVSLEAHVATLETQMEGLNIVGNPEIHLLDVVGDDGLGFKDFIAANPEMFPGDYINPMGHVLDPSK
jgi:hypothetical protein